MSGYKTYIILQGGKSSTILHQNLLLRHFIEILEMLGFMSRLSNLKIKTCITLQGGQSSGCKLGELFPILKLPEIQCLEKY